MTTREAAITKRLRKGDRIRRPWDTTITVTCVSYDPTEPSRLAFQYDDGRIERSATTDIGDPCGEWTFADRSPIDWTPEPPSSRRPRPGDRIRRSNWSKLDNAEYRGRSDDYDIEIRWNGAPSNSISPRHSTSDGPWVFAYDGVLVDWNQDPEPTPAPVALNTVHGLKKGTVIRMDVLVRTDVASYDGAVRLIAISGGATDGTIYVNSDGLVLANAVIDSWAPTPARPVKEGDIIEDGEGVQFTFYAYTARVAPRYPVIAARLSNGAMDGYPLARNFTHLDGAPIDWDASK